MLSDPGDLFPDHSWIAAMLGQGIRPASSDPLVDSLPLEKVRRFTRHVAEVTAQAAQSMPDHDDFIARNCNASPSYSADGVSDSYS